MEPGELDSIIHYREIMALHRQLIKLTPVSRTFSPEPRSHWPTWAVKHDEALAHHHNNNNNTNNNNNKSMVMDAGPMNLPRFSPWLGSAQRTLLSGRVSLDIHWNFQPAGIIRIISMITMWVIEWRRSPVDPPLYSIPKVFLSFSFHFISFDYYFDFFFLMS